MLVVVSPSIMAMSTANESFGYSVSPVSTSCSLVMQVCHGIVMTVLVVVVVLAETSPRSF